MHDKHNWVVAEPELRRHCMRCGLEQKGYEENGKIVWEDVVPQTVYDTCNELDIFAFNI